MKTHGPDQAAQASGETPPVFLVIIILRVLCDKVLKKITLLFYSVIPFFCLLIASSTDASMPNALNKTSRIL